MGPNWYYMSGTSVTGPLTATQLHAELVANRLSEQTRLFTSDGLHTSSGALRNWLQASLGGHVPGLAAASSSVVVTQTPEGVSIRWPWRHGDRGVAYGTLALAVMLSVGEAALQAAFDVGPWRPIATFVAVSALGYLAAVLLINGTELSIDGRRLIVRHGPLPSWRRDAEIALQEVSELYVTASGDRWLVRASRWQAPPVTLAVAREAHDAVAVHRGLLSAFFRSGFAPLASESAEERAAKLLGLVAPRPTAAVSASGAAQGGPALGHVAPAIEPVLTKGITVWRDRSAPHGALVVTRSWRTLIGVVIFAVWLVFAVLLPLTPLLDGKPYESRHLVAIPLVLLTGYFPLAMAFNRTRFEVREGVLSIRHRPLPWLGGKTVDLSHVVQIYCRDTREHRDPTCRLEALMADGRSVVLWKYNANLVPDAQVVAVERHLESFLSIGNQPVAGELQRPLRQWS